MIQLRNLTKEYDSGIVAVKNVTLTIESKDVYGIVGLSGAGKSTLIRMINRLESPTKGSVIIDEMDITKASVSDLRKKRQEIGMIFQHFNLLSSRDVYGNVAYPLEVIGCSKVEIDKKVKWALEVVQLTEKINSMPSQLSGGQKQRVAIARAIVTEPKLLLCDEATSALDPQTTKTILNLLLEINKTLGLTIALITHEMDVISEICNKVAVMDQGQIAETGLVKDVFYHPKHEITKSLLNHLPRTVFNLTNDKRDLQLTFDSTLVNEAIITTLVKEFDVDVNILSAEIDHLKEDSIGHLKVRITGQKRREALVWLEKIGVELEGINDSY